MKKDKTPLEFFIISWNLRFKYDRFWRKKYNIPFGSEAHRNMNQIDIYLDIREDYLFEQAQSNRLEREQNAEEYKKGIFLKEQVLSKEDEDNLLRKIRF